jgi:hypothetical protein
MLKYRIIIIILGYILSSRSMSDIRLNKIYNYQGYNVV